MFKIVFMLKWLNIDNTTCLISINKLKKRGKYP